MSDSHDATDEPGRQPSDDRSEAQDAARLARVFDLRRADRTLGACPPAARARARSLLAAARPAGLLARARCLFDSWLAPAEVALRGPEAVHVLRFGQGELRADVEIATSRAGIRQVTVALEHAPTDAVARLVLGTEEELAFAALALALDEHGTGSVEVPADAGPVELEVFDGARALLRSDPIPLDPPA